MDKILTADQQKAHKELVAMLQATFAQKELAQDNVNKAIRELRAKERKIAQLAAELSNFEQLNLTLLPREQDER